MPMQSLHNSTINTYVVKSLYKSSVLQSCHVTYKSNMKSMIKHSKNLKSTLLG